MTTKICQALSKQINEELFSSYLYLSMSAYFESRNFKGFANWMRVQSKEEIDHAMGLFNHLLERGETVEFEEIKKPKTNFKDTLTVCEEILAHEKFITSKIYKLYELSTAEKDFALQSVLKWYIDEQVEEEANAQELIDKVGVLGNKGDALYLLDRELATRVYVPATILVK